MALLKVLENSSLLVLKLARKTVGSYRSIFDALYSLFLSLSLSAAAAAAAVAAAAATAARKSLPRMLETLDNFGYPTLAHQTKTQFCIGV